MSSCFLDARPLPAQLVYQSFPLQAGAREASAAVEVVQAALTAVRAAPAGSMRALCAGPESDDALVQRIKLHLQDFRIDAKKYIQAYTPQELPGEYLYFFDDDHWDQQGSSICHGTARALVRYLKVQGVIREKPTKIWSSQTWKDEQPYRGIYHVWMVDKNSANEWEHEFVFIDLGRDVFIVQSNTFIDVKVSDDEGIIEIDRDTLQEMLRGNAHTCEGLFGVGSDSEIAIHEISYYEILPQAAVY